jgi:hypothetical protein
LSKCSLRNPSEITHSFRLPHLPKRRDIEVLSLFLGEAGLLNDSFGQLHVVRIEWCYRRNIRDLLAELHQEASFC